MNRKSWDQLISTAGVWACHHVGRARRARRERRQLRAVERADRRAPEHHVPAARGHDARGDRSTSASSPASRSPTGRQAEAFSRYIGGHLVDVNDGATYSETSAAAREEGLDPDVAAEPPGEGRHAVQGRDPAGRSCWNAYGWWTAATIAIYAGYIMIVIGLVFGALSFSGSGVKSHRLRPRPSSSFPPTRSPRASDLARTDRAVTPLAHGAAREPPGGSARIVGAMNSFQGLTSHHWRVPAEPFEVTTEDGVRIAGSRLGAADPARPALLLAHGMIGWHRKPRFADLRRGAHPVVHRLCDGHARPRPQRRGVRLRRRRDFDIEAVHRLARDAGHATAISCGTSMGGDRLDPAWPLDRRHRRRRGHLVARVLGLARRRTSQSIAEGAIAHRHPGGTRCPAGLRGANA